VACPDEEILLAFLDGRLSSQRVSEVDAHLSGCADCGRVVAEVAPVLLAAAGGGGAPPSATGAPTTFARGASVGRYLLLDLVGRSELAEVYAAYDPELDRKVAVKLLHEAARPESAERARARLLRAVKALGRLSHPNVVAVHEAGTIGERVFIAMDFVEGSTVDDWLRQSPRTWRDVRAVFLAAGRGLEAAHEAGIVHRNFGPRAVRVSAGGAVRVLDLELGSEAGGAASATRLGSVGSGPATLALTSTDSSVGTPAHLAPYLAPEQLRGERVDARTDQFGFCVALYEALHGERPFPSALVPALLEAMSAGQVRAPAKKSAVPAWLREVVLRGLRPDPRERWPSMTELLVALGRDPQRRRRRALVGAVVAALLVGGGVSAARALRRADPALCVGAGARLAGVWEPLAASGAPASPRRAAMRAAFLSTGLSFAPDTWQRVSAVLDRYTARWAAAGAEVCQWTRVRGEPSTDPSDLRRACLDRGLGGLRALTSVFANPDRDVVTRAVSAANELPDLARCDDVGALRAAVPPPTDAQARARVDALRARVAELKALCDTGKPTAVVARGPGLLGELRDLGYDPLLSDGLFVVGHAHQSLGEAAVAERLLDEAVMRALASRYDEPAVDAIAVLATMNARDRERSAEAERWLRIGEAILARLGPGHDRARGSLERARGAVHLRQARLGDAANAFSTAAALAEKAGGRDDIDVASALDSLGLVLMESGDLPRALPASERALAIATAAFGEGSPGLGQYLNDRGEVLNAAGRPGEAMPLYRRAMESWEPLGSKNPSQAYPLTGIGQALLQQGKAAEAVTPLERALELRTLANEVHQDLGATRFALARALWDGGGDRSRARALAAAARDDYLSLESRTAKRQEVDRWLERHHPSGTPARSASPWPR
jgi:tetratricopeptide (TPR) repeat protein